MEVPSARVRLRVEEVCSKLLHVFELIGMPIYLVESRHEEVGPSL